MADHLMALKEELAKMIEVAEQERDQVLEAVRLANEELSAKTREAADVQIVVDELKRVADARGKEEVRLDVGGRCFTLERAVLTQCKDTVLAMLAGSRWSDGRQDKDGVIFLDVNPDDFEEIVSFLQARRRDPDARSSFGARAVGLAIYLGVPVDQVTGGQSRVAEFAHVGEKRGMGLAFSARLPHPSCGILEALEFNLDMPAACRVYAKPGSFAEASLSRAADWREAWKGELQAGRNTVPLQRMHLRNGEPHSFYLFCSRSSLAYSTEAPPSDAGEEAALVVMPGRAVRELFQWPITGEFSALNTRHRHFAGTVKYTHYTVAGMGV